MHPYSLLLPLLILASAPSFADTLRCGTDLISSGDNRLDVIEACGEPDHKEQIVYYTPIRERYFSSEGRWLVKHSTAPRYAELWYYKPNRLRFTVRFEAGKIVSIESD